MDVAICPAASGSPDAVLILAHGAGAGQHSPFMKAAARGLASRGVTVATFDFPYVRAHRKTPDAGPVLEGEWRDVIQHARSHPQLGRGPLFIGGKSLGGRIASQVAAQANAGPLAGIVFLGYPLHPPGKPQQRRDAHLPRITAPMLFVQGTRDPFGSADEIRALLQALPRATLHEIAGGDHSFKVPAKIDKSQAEVMDGVLEAVADWIRRLA